MVDWWPTVAQTAPDQNISLYQMFSVLEPVHGLVVGSPRFKGASKLHQWSHTRLLVWYILLLPVKMRLNEWHMLMFKWQGPLVAVRSRRKSGGADIERHSPGREEVGVEGWVNKISDFNTKDHRSFPVSNCESALLFFYSTTVIVS